MASPLEWLHVVALQTLWWLVQIEDFGQGVEACGHVLSVGQARAQGLLGIGHRQLLPTRAGAAYAVADVQLAATQFVDRLDQGRGSLRALR